ncbi:translation initiation factor IF-3 [Saccharibacillus sp. CPCC 101409]|uniref:translation initiation factor IF-3 n=1 Tax=Saccharibacillus sp. CPCC 101409 TaxID=3058041 RepID=UPI0026734A0C|nr:translation initiation factor IF-3 [Saccharibacillus sp. CPCC 101409]MDO3408291.1 translation initiation factor IF-3 [Saccharibacillus sp. CPCC 101409]
MIKNEKIKAAEVDVTGVNGEALGVMTTSEALKLAKELGVDLVCTSLYSSPPPCSLISSGKAREARQQEKKAARPAKVKEIRLTPNIEEHDYETKKNQAQRILQGGDSVQFVVKVSGKEGAKAKELLEELLRDLKADGQKKTGIQISGKQAAVQVDPI